MSEPRRIDRPGVFDLTAEEYFADPCPEPSLSSSLIKILLNRSPLHAKSAHPRLRTATVEPEKSKKALNIGSGAHALLLNAGRRIVEVKANDWKKPANQELRDVALAGGNVPLLSRELALAHEMVAACRAQLLDHEAGDMFDDGIGEQTLAWQEPNGIWCRALVDWLPAYRGRGMMLTDYKTSGMSAHQSAWGARTLWNLGFDIQEAFYRRGAAAVFGGGIATIGFQFLIQEQEPPYAINVVRLPPPARMIPERDVERAVTLWGQCLRRNQWPGYPNRIHFVEPPAWVEHQRLEREADTPLSSDMIRAMVDFQAP